MMYGFPISYSLAKTRAKCKHHRTPRKLIVGFRNYQERSSTQESSWAEARKPRKRCHTKSKKTTKTRLHHLLTSTVYFVPTSQKYVVCPVKVYDHDGDNTSADVQSEYSIKESNMSIEATTPNPVDRTDTMLLFSSHYKSSDSTDELVLPKYESRTSSYTENSTDSRRQCYISTSGTLCMSEDMYPLFVEWYNFLQKNKSNLKKNFQFFGKMKTIPLHGNKSDETSNVSSTTADTTQTVSALESDSSMLMQKDGSHRYPSFLTYDVMYGTFSNLERRKAEEKKRRKKQSEANMSTSEAKFEDTRPIKKIQLKPDDKKPICEEPDTTIVDHPTTSRRATIGRTTSRYDSIRQKRSKSDNPSKTIIEECQKSIKQYQSKDARNVQTSRSSTSTPRTQSQHLQSQDSKQKVDISKSVVNHLVNVRLDEELKRTKLKAIPSVAHDLKPTRTKPNLQASNSYTDRYKYIESLKAKEEERLKKIVQEKTYLQLRSSIISATPSKNLVTNKASKARVRPTRTVIDKEEPSTIEDDNPKIKLRKLSSMVIDAKNKEGVKEEKKPRCYEGKEERKPRSHDVTEERKPKGTEAKEEKKSRGQKVKDERRSVSTSSKEEAWKYSSKGKDVMKEVRDAIKESKELRKMSTVDVKRKISIDESQKKAKEHQEKANAEDINLIKTKKPVGFPLKRKEGNPPSAKTITSTDEKRTPISKDTKRTKDDPKVEDPINDKQEKPKPVRRSLFRRSSNKTEESNQSNSKASLTSSEERPKRNQTFRKFAQRFKDDSRNSSPVNITKTALIDRGRTMTTPNITNKSDVPTKSSSFLGRNISSTSRCSPKSLPAYTPSVTNAKPSSDQVFKHIEKDWPYWERLLLLEKFTEEINEQDKMMKKNLKKYKEDKRKTKDQREIKSLRDSLMTVVPLFYNKNVHDVTDSEAFIVQENQMVTDSSSSGASTSTARFGRFRKTKAGSKHGDKSSEVFHKPSTNSSVYSFIRKYLMCVNVSGSSMEHCEQEEDCRPARIYSPTIIEECTESTETDNLITSSSTIRVAAESSVDWNQDTVSEMGLDEADTKVRLQPNTLRDDMPESLHRRLMFQLRMNLPDTEACLLELGYVNDDNAEELHLDTPKFEKIARSLANDKYDVCATPEEIRMVAEITEDQFHEQSAKADGSEDLSDFMRISLGSGNVEEEEQKVKKKKKKKKKKKGVKGDDSTSLASIEGGSVSTADSGVTEESGKPDESEPSVAEETWSPIPSLEPLPSLDLQQFELPPEEDVPPDVASEHEPDEVSEHKSEEKPEEEEEETPPKPVVKPEIKPIPEVTDDWQPTKARPPIKQQSAPPPDDDDDSDEPAYEASTHSDDWELPPIRPRPKQEEPEEKEEEEQRPVVQQTRSEPTRYTQETKPKVESETKPKFERETKPTFERETKPKVESETKPIVESETKPIVESPTKPKVESRASDPGVQKPKQDVRSVPRTFTKAADKPTVEDSGPEEPSPKRKRSSSGEKIQPKKKSLDDSPEEVLVDLDENEEIDCDCGGFKFVLKAADVKDKLDQFKISYLKNRLVLTAPSKLREALQKIGGSRSTQTVKTETENDPEKPGDEPKKAGGDPKPKKKIISWQKIRDAGIQCCDEEKQRYLCSREEEDWIAASEEAMKIREERKQLRRERKQADKDHKREDARRKPKDGEDHDRDDGAKPSNKPSIFDKLKRPAKKRKPPCKTCNESCGQTSSNEGGSAHKVCARNKPKQDESEAHFCTVSTTMSHIWNYGVVQKMPLTDSQERRRKRKKKKKKHHRRERKSASATNITSEDSKRVFKRDFQVYHHYKSRYNHYRRPRGSLPLISNHQDAEAYPRRGKKEVRINQKELQRLLEAILPKMLEHSYIRMLNSSTEIDDVKRSPSQDICIEDIAPEGEIKMVEACAGILEDDIPCTQTSEFQELLMKHNLIVTVLEDFSSKHEPPKYQFRSDELSRVDEEDSNNLVDPVEEEVKNPPRKKLKASGAITWSIVPEARKPIKDRATSYDQMPKTISSSEDDKASMIVQRGSMEEESDDDENKKLIKSEMPWGNKPTIVQMFNIKRNIKRSSTQSTTVGIRMSSVNALPVSSTNVVEEEEDKHIFYQLAGGLKYYYAESNSFKDTDVQCSESKDTHEPWNLYDEDVFDNSIFEKGSTHSRYETSCAVQISPTPITNRPNVLDDREKQIQRLEKRLHKNKKGLAPEQLERRKKKILHQLKKLRLGKDTVSSVFDDKKHAIRKKKEAPLEVSLSGTIGAVNSSHAISAKKVAYTEVLVDKDVAYRKKREARRAKLKARRDEPLEDIPDEKVTDFLDYESMRPLDKIAEAPSREMIREEIMEQLSETLMLVVEKAEQNKVSKKRRRKKSLYPRLSDLAAIDEIPKVEVKIKKPRPARFDEKKKAELRRIAMERDRMEMEMKHLTKRRVVDDAVLRRKAAEGKKLLDEIRREEKVKADARRTKRKSEDETPGASGLQPRVSKDRKMSFKKRLKPEKVIPSPQYIINYVAPRNSDGKFDEKAVPESSTSTVGSSGLLRILASNLGTLSNIGDIDYDQIEVFCSDSLRKKETVVGSSSVGDVVSHDKTNPNEIGDILKLFNRLLSIMSRSKVSM